MYESLNKELQHQNKRRYPGLMEHTEYFSLCSLEISHNLHKWKSLLKEFQKKTDFSHGT